MLIPSNLLHSRLSLPPLIFVLTFISLIFNLTTSEHIELTVSSPPPSTFPLITRGKLLSLLNPESVPDKINPKINGKGNIRRTLYGSFDTALKDVISCFTFQATIDGQVVTLILDTGSSDTWVFEGPSFSSSSSIPATFQLQSGEIVSDVKYNVSYLDGSHMSLMAYTGKMKIGNDTFSFPQTFGAGKPDLQTQGTFDGLSGVDGLSGFAFQEMSVINVPTPTQSFSPPSFGLWLPSRRSEPSMNPGVLTLGGTNSTLFEGTELTYYPLNLYSLSDYYSPEYLSERGITDEESHKKQYNSGFWDVKFEDISLNNKTVQSNITAILDSGTTNLVGPEDTVRKISEALDAMCIAFKKSDILEYESNPSLGFWHIPKKLYPCATSDILDPEIYVTYGDIRLVDCSVPLAMTFTIKGDVYKITSDNLIFPFTQNQCGEGLMDCIGQCFPLDYEANKDGVCDNGEIGVFTNCPRFNCDGPQLCALAIQTFPNTNPDGEDNQGPFSMANTWLMGDTFLRGVYVGHDYEGRRVGLSHALHTDDGVPVQIHTDDGGPEEIPKDAANDETHAVLFITVSVAAAFGFAFLVILAVRGRQNFARPAARGFSKLEQNLQLFQKQEGDPKELEGARGFGGSNDIEMTEI